MGRNLKGKGKIVQGLFSDVKMPPTLDYEELSKQANVDLYYQTDIRFDISKAKSELGFAPMPPLEAIKQTLLYLRNWQ